MAENMRFMIYMCKPSFVSFSNVNYSLWALLCSHIDNPFIIPSPCASNFGSSAAGYSSSIYDLFERVLGMQCATLNDHSCVQHSCVCYSYNVTNGNPVLT